MDDVKVNVQILVAAPLFNSKKDSRLEITPPELLPLQLPLPENSTELYVVQSQMFIDLIENRRGSLPQERISAEAMQAAMGGGSLPKAGPATSGQTPATGVR